MPKNLWSFHESFVTSKGWLTVSGGQTCKLQDILVIAVRALHKNHDIHLKKITAGT